MPARKSNTEQEKTTKQTPAKKTTKKKATRNSKGQFVHGNKEGNRFQKGQSGNPAGKQKAIYTILKQKGYQKHDIKACFGELLFYQPDEIDELITNQHLYPAITIIVAKAIKGSMKRGSMNQILTLIEYTIGKPTATANVNHTGLNLGVEYVDDDED